MSEGKKYTIGCSLAFIGFLAICGVANLGTTRYGQPEGGQFFLILAVIGLVILLAVLGLQKAAANTKAQEQVRLERTAPPAPPAQELPPPASPQSRISRLFVPQALPEQPGKRTAKQEGR